MDCGIIGWMVYYAICRNVTLDDRASAWMYQMEYYHFVNTYPPRCNDTAPWSAIWILLCYTLERIKYAA